MFVDRREDAERQFRLLLEQDPEYLLDLSFPPDVRALFDTVREQVLQAQHQAAAQRAREEAERRAREIDRIRRQQEREMRLRELASTETIETHNSRWLAMLPFGIGQFQNGHEALGWGLLISEVLLAGASLTSAIIWNSLADEPAHPEALEQNLRLLNAISSGLFYATALGGILDAQLRFVPVHRTTRERDLPPELEPDYEEPTVDVAISPFGGSFQLRF
jgi:hypothetical protein